MLPPEKIAAILEGSEDAGQCRMIDRSALVVGFEILLADISDVARFPVLREEVVEGLVLSRADFLGDRIVPFFGVRKDGIDVEDHAAEIENAVADHVPDRKMGVRNRGRAELAEG
jgi:hypothetical protein